MVKDSKSLNNLVLQGTNLIHLLYDKYDFPNHLGTPCEMGCEV